MKHICALLCFGITALSAPADRLADVGCIRAPKSAGLATVRTFDIQLPPGDINVGGASYNPCGHIEIVSPDGATNCVRWVAESRGETFDLNPITAFSGSLVPGNLQWDSTEPFLYFEFGGGAAASGVWRVHATNSVPRYVGPTRESFRLLPRSDGPDHVVCNQVRNGKSLWFAYTPEDIAKPQHMFHTNVVTTVSNTFSDSHLAEQAARLSGFYSHIYPSWIYVAGDTPDALPKEEPMQGCQWLRIQHVGGGNLESDMYVLGDNAHQGRIEGLARMTSPNIAEFTASDGLPGEPLGKLLFEFDGDSVTVTELEDCSLYRGERVTFDDTLERAYKIISDSSADSMGITVLHAGQPVYRYTAHYLKPFCSMPPGVDIAYDRLANRAGKPQPRPYDDILGNGLPDLVINEYVITGNNTATYTNMLTIISMNGTNVTQTPAVPCIGEVFYFKDFNNDGCMEIVNTDWEQGFREFDTNGIPMHKGVWKYDPKAGRYWETGTEHPDPPDTWPAYHNDPATATPPSAP